MFKGKSKSIAVLGLLLVVACTQEPADVEYRGNQYYGREHQGALDSPNHETYPVNSPRYKEDYTHPVEPAAVPNVGVADLPPPVAVQSSNLAPLASPKHAPLVPAVSAPAPTIVASTADTSRFMWPVMGGKIISHFGAKRDGHPNDGINIAIDEGEPILAAAGGTVIYAGNDLKGYGNMVILRHSDGWMTAYAHARQIAVQKGDTIKQGQVIAYVGTTGGVKGPQLHFVVREGKTPVDPEQFLPKAHS